MKCIKAMRSRWLHLVVTLLVAVLWSRTADAYDMLDYMRHDTKGVVNNLTIRIGGVNTDQIQMIGEYDIVPGRSFYITKNYDGIGATEFEEFEYDANYIYLVRDTSWQSHAWCDGQDTSFELWTNGLNRGAWIPRYVTSGTVYTTPAFEIRARKEGGSCLTCNSLYDSDGAQVTRTIRATHWNSITLNGNVLNDIMEIEVIAGPGTNEEYFFSKTLGWVGYRDPSMASYYSGLAGGGAPLNIVARDTCPIKNPDMEKTATSVFGRIATWGPNGGWAWHSDYPRSGNSTLGAKFGFYAAGTTEKVGQVLNTKFQANKTYVFGGYVQGGGDNTGVVPFEIGYASIAGDLNSFQLLARATWTVGSSWGWADGVSYFSGASGAHLGKQIIVRFGSNGASDIWFDNLKLTVY